MEVPVLLIVFNRTSTVRRVFSEIRAQKPKRLFVAADGPRIDILNEDKVCKEVRSIVTEIDWECELMTLFRSENLGCGKAVSSAISWFFEHVEEGIILEDDCLPNNNFFTFCEEMLLKFRDSYDVMHIGGVNYHEWNGKEVGDYYHSRYGHIWGWATWRRAWENYNLIISDGPDDINKALQILCTKRQRFFWHKIFLNQRDNPVDTWDYSWQYTLFKMKGYCIYPNYTLVDNIGFGIGSTHTKTEPKILPASKLHQRLKAPFKPSCITKKYFLDYLDYINFERAFKNKNMNIYSIKSVLKYLKERCNDC